MKLSYDNVKPLLGTLSKESPQWFILESLVGGLQSLGRFPNSIKLSRPFDEASVDVIERIGDKVVFWYQRNAFSSRRSTSIDRYGLIGLSDVNLQNRRAIITEGVSDFITVKSLYPKSNVLGFTTLGGNIKSAKIILSLFDSIAFVCDNDFTKERNTGLTNGFSLKTFYESYGKKVYLYMPDFPFKDITEQFLKEVL